jgi:hypothetical protein
MYMGFLMSEPKSSTCTRLSEVMGISHDSVNRFLLRERATHLRRDSRQSQRITDG